MFVLQNNISCLYTPWASLDRIESGWKIKVHEYFKTLLETIIFLLFYKLISRSEIHDFYYAFKDCITFYSFDINHNVVSCKYSF